MVNVQYILANNDDDDNAVLEGWTKVWLPLCTECLAHTSWHLFQCSVCWWWCGWWHLRGWSYWWPKTQRTYRHSLGFICIDDDGDSMMTVTGTVTLRVVNMTSSRSPFAFPTGTTSSVFAFVFPKNLPIWQICWLTCFAVSLPGLSALLICCAALLSSCALVCLHLSVEPAAPLAHTQVQETNQPLFSAGPFLCQWLFGSHVKEPAYQPLRTMGSARTYEVWPFMALCKTTWPLWSVSFQVWKRADVVGSKLICLCKSGANAQTWSGRGSWNALVQEVCHPALCLCFPREGRGLLRRAGSPLAWDLKKALEEGLSPFQNQDKGRLGLCPVVPKVRIITIKICLRLFFWGACVFPMNLVGWAFGKYAPPPPGVVQILNV